MYVAIGNISSLYLVFICGAGAITAALCVYNTENRPRYARGGTSPIHSSQCVVDALRRRHRHAPRSIPHT